MGEWREPTLVVVIWLVSVSVWSFVGGFLGERRRRRESDTSTIPSEAPQSASKASNAGVGSPVTTQAGTWTEEPPDTGLKERR